MCTRTCAQREREREREVQMPAYDSILRDHIDANEANARHVIARVEDPRSAGWMLSCQWLIPSASHRFLFFFFLQDLISIPTQSFRILSSFLPNLPLLLFLLCQPISSGSSRNDANYRKEADVTAKHPCDGEESSRVVSPLLFPSLSWKFQPFQPHFFHIWHLHSLHFFLFFFFCAFLLLRTSHHCQRITHFGLSDVWAACFLHLLLWEFQTFFMQACIWREIKACVMALWCATNLPIWCKSKAQWSLSLGGKRLWWKGFWGGELHTVHQY